MKNIKLFAMFIAGLSITALATYAAPVAIEAAINSFTLYMNRILVTTTGGPDGQVVVDINNMDSSAALLVNSTTRGFLPPRLTTAQRDNINNPAKGLIIFNTDLGFHQSYNGPSGNQAEYWHGVGAACPSVSIVQIQDTQLDPMLQFGAGFYSVGNNGTDLTIKASQPEDLLGMATIAGVPFYVQGAIIIDGNNNRVLSAGERSLFDESKLYGTLYMTPSGLIPLNGNNMTVTKTTGRSILGGVVAENNDVFVYICGEFVTGCTDTDAENYDPQANLDDGSCTLPTQVDMYFASGSNAVYSENTGSNIIFSSAIHNAMCADAASSAVTVTATWNTTSGISPSYISASSMYGPANVAGNTATWTIDPMYIGCSEIPLSVTLYNGALGQVTVDWTVSIAGDTKPGNDTMSQYGTWQAQQGGGGANYDYSIFSGNGSSFNTTSSGNLYPSITVGGSAYNGCLAGYGIQVSASLPTASASYVSANGGMMGVGGTYNGSTVTRTYTGTDPMQCSYLANNAIYSVTLYSMMSGSDTIAWNIGPALPGSNDGNPMNNYTTQYLTRSMPGGGGANYDYGISSGTPGYPSTTAGNNITGSINIINVQSACEAGYGVRVVAQLPWGASYVSSSAGMMGTVGSYDAMMNTVTWNYTGTTTCRDLATDMYAYRVVLNSPTAFSGNINWSVSAANPGNTDSNASNNNGTQYLTWNAQSGVDVLVSTPITPLSGSIGSNLTGAIYMSELSGNVANNVTIIATLPNYMSSATPATLVGATAGYSQNGNILTRNIGSASYAGPYQVVLQGNAAETQYVFRDVTTSDSDTNNINNSYIMPFTRY